MTGLEVLEVSFFNPLVLFYSDQVFNTFSGPRPLFGRLSLASLPLHGRRGCDPCCEGGIDISYHMNQFQTLKTVYIDIFDHDHSDQNTDGSYLRSKALVLSCWSCSTGLYQPPLIAVNNFLL